MSPVSDDQAAEWLRVYPGREQASLSDPYDATAQTVRYMVRLVKHSLSDPIISQAWNDAWTRFGGFTGGSPSQCAWWYAKTILSFVHHQKLLLSWLGRGDELQLLISPEAVLKMRDPKGDCAVYTTLICALLSIARVPWEIVTIACDPRQSPDVFSHVYPRAILKDGRRIVLDASHGPYPGWEVPAERITRKQVWDSDGNALQDLDSGYRGLGDVLPPAVTGTPVPAMQTGAPVCPGSWGSATFQEGFSQTLADPKGWIFALLQLSQLNSPNPGNVVSPDGQSVCFQANRNTPGYSIGAALPPLLVLGLAAYLLFWRK